MYRDNSLIPIEAMRIAALGVLAERPMRYAEIAADIRQFTSRIVGPSLDLMGSSVEVLRTEELIAPLAAEAGQPDPHLTLTAAGHERLITLLQTGLKAASTDLNRLVIALKMRFLHLLPRADRQNQIELLQELLRAERARYQDLQSSGGGSDLFAAWLGFELKLLDARLDWLDSFAASCAQP